MDTNYSFPFEIMRLKDSTFPKLLAKEIILDKRQALTKAERELKSIANSLNYLASNVSSAIAVPLIKESYYLLTHKQLNKDKASKIVSKYYQYIDCDLEELIINLLEALNVSIHYSKLQYAILLIYFLFLKKRKEVVITKKMKPLLLQMLKDKRKLTELLWLFRNSTIENKGKGLDKNEVLDYFARNRRELKLRFPIKRLYLFGSYADGMYNENSDLDLLVIFDDEVTGVESLSLKNSLTEYLKNQLKTPVDIIQFQYAMDYMDIMSLNKILTIY